MELFEYNKAGARDIGNSSQRDEAGPALPLRRRASSKARKLPGSLDDGEDSVEPKRLFMQMWTEHALGPTPNSGNRD